MIRLNTLNKPPFSSAESTVLSLFKFFPDFPQFLIKLFLRITPFLAFAAGILHFLSLFAPPFLINPLRPFSLFISGIFLLVAYKPLSQRQSFGITLLFWSSIIYGLINFIWLPSPSTALITTLSLYFIYQIRPHYTRQ